MNSITKTRKPARRTWLGAAGIDWTWELKDGERLSVILWLDDSVGQPIERAAGTYVIRVLTGDNLKGTLEILADYAVTSRSEAEAIAGEIAGDTITLTDPK